ncbi:MAG: DUF3987 domain-containing protein [bacterium]|nr:DUF3987 domain-containing protein [bacterium]
MTAPKEAGTGAVPAASKAETANTNASNSSPLGEEGQATPLLDAALVYARHGWPVFPCRGKRPATPHGFKDATTDVDAIREWWRTWPEANVAIATGPAGLLVLDLDVKNGQKGIEEMRRLEEKNDALPVCPSVSTPSGGAHYYLRVPEGHEVKCSASKLAPGVDVRATGGYIVAPPSRLADGGQYAWQEGVDEVALPEAPTWLLCFLDSPRSRRGDCPADGGQGEEPEIIEKGGRNDALTRFAGRLRSGGLTGDELLAALDKMNANRCRPSLPRSEVRSIAASVQRYARGEDPPPPLPRVKRPKAESFPVEALGSILGAAAEALHEYVQAPLAMCGSAVLAAASACCQAQADVHVDGRVYATSVFCLTVAESGDRKSAIDTMATRPLRERERELTKRYEHEMGEYERAASIYEAERSRTLRSGSLKGLEAKKSAVEELGPAPSKPLRPVLLVSNFTVEGVSRQLAEGWPSLGIFSDEGGQTVGGHAMSKDNELKTLAELSKRWDAHGDGMRLRSGDGVRAILGRRVCMHLAMQPAVARLLLGNPLAHGQGFLPRCLLSWPETLRGTRFYRSGNPSEDCRVQVYYETLAKLLELPLPWDESGEVALGLAPRAMQLTPEGYDAYVGFYDSVEEQNAPDGPLSCVAAWASKAAEHAVRIAGILSLVDDPDACEVEEIAFRSGATLAEWYMAEYLRVSGLAAEDATSEQADEVLAFIEAQGGAADATLLMRAGPRAVRSRSGLDKVMEYMETTGMVERETARRSGRSKRTWRIAQ